MSCVSNLPAQITVSAFGRQESRGDSCLAAWLRASGVVYQAPAGSTIFQQGTPCQELTYLEDGWIMLFRTEGTGVDVIVGLHQAGTILDAGAAVSSLPHPATAVARTPVRVRQVPVAALDEAIRQGYGFERELLRELGRETVLHVARCGTLACLNARQRFERLLADLAASLPNSPTRIPLRQSDLAGLLGIDGSHARRLVRTLRREGIINTSRGWITVPDARRLRAS